MKPSNLTAGRLLALALAGAALASCTAHGQSANSGRKAYYDLTPYSADFYNRLLPDRVRVFEGTGRFRNVVQGVVFGADGTVYRCVPGRVEGKRSWWTSSNIRWSTHRAGNGGELLWQRNPQERRYSAHFYDPETGGLATEIYRKGAYIVATRGHIQDSWPRALADACPDLKIPAHIRINEKQTSLRMDELRRQDPDAPVRHFPGSQLTSPGRTGLGRSGNRPTTTRAEVDAWLEAQEGNVLFANKRIGLTYVRAGDREELWRIGHWNMTDGYWDIVRTADEAGEWIEIHDGPRVRYRYLVGYPFYYLPTGHRHAAFQLTDEFIARPYPRSLAFMGEAYADRRFVFHPEGKFSVVDEAGTLVEGPHFDGTWRWTRGRLEMTVRDDPAGPRSIGWRELAADLDMQPTVWTRHTPDRY